MTTLFSTYVYGHDNADRIKQVDAATKLGALDLKRRETYDYDDAGQLTSVAPNLTDQLPGSRDLSTGFEPSQAFVHDQAGNRKTENGVPQTIEAGGNRVINDGSFEYAYDAEGNLEKKTQLVGVPLLPNGLQTLYVWDNRNRLIEVNKKSSPAGSVTEQVKYLYNNDDLRVARKCLSTATEFRRKPSISFTKEANFRSFSTGRAKCGIAFSTPPEPTRC